MLAGGSAFIGRKPDAHEPDRMTARVVIVSPALADANNGNWQTARRWQILLAPLDVRIVKAWPDAQASSADGVMLALHARRSAESIAAWAETRKQPARTEAPGLAVVLTGTDLYQDIHTDSAAQHSLEVACRLVVLQDRAPDAVPAPMQPKARVVFQSTAALAPVAKTDRQLRAVMVGHLRSEKSPETLFAAAQRLAQIPESGVFIDHIGDALDPALGQAAAATAAACPNYRWLGGVAHEATRRHIQRAHVLVHASRLEGGAHVIMEAVRSGTPVLASRIDGNVGMLGADYAGYFAVGDDDALAALLLRCRAAQVTGGADAQWLANLQAQCALRSALFAPEAEQAALRALVHELQASCASY
jgi:putative glycosyltransferase (TIGR04348 family)